MSNIQRNSAHELLRIVAMLLIVIYHLLSYYLYLIPHDSSMDAIMEACIPSLHVGVILFVLISGYYSIRPSISGLFKFLFVIFIYFVPLKLAQCIYSHSNPLNALLFITNSPYWFIRTYLYLFLTAPILNKFLDTSSRKSKNIMLLVLGLIAVYWGTMQGDDTLWDGKNLVNFMFLYFLGNAIREYKDKWQTIPQSYFGLIWFVMNAAIIVILSLYGKDTIFGHYVWQLSFPYCSPLLIANAVLIFMMFSNFNFASKAVNYIASSMFAVYLIHVHPTIHNYLIMSILRHTPPMCFTVCVTVIAIGVVAACVGIDKMLTPVWNMGKRVGKSLETKIAHK